MILAICSSASFYPQIVALSYKLEERGITVAMPKAAARMKTEGVANVEVVSDWAKAGYHAKANFIREHFDTIAKSDAILVANYVKHGKESYIGPNVLMEMAISFYLKKSIYVLNGPPEESPLIDEILGLEPVFLDGDIGKISL